MQPFACWESDMLCLGNKAFSNDGAGCSGNNKAHLPFCPLDTDCSHTVYARGKVAFSLVLCTDISLFTSITVSSGWSVSDNLQGISLWSKWNLAVTHTHTQHVCVNKTHVVSVYVWSGLLHLSLKVGSVYYCLWKIVLHQVRPVLRGNEGRNKTEANVMLSKIQCLSAFNSLS